jgi:hypothetical protein
MVATLSRCHGDDMNIKMNENFSNANSVRRRKWPRFCVWGEVSRRSGTGFPTFGVFRTDNGVPVHAHITHPTQQDMISLAHNYPSSLHTHLIKLTRILVSYSKMIETSSLYSHRDTGYCGGKGLPIAQSGHTTLSSSVHHSCPTPKAMAKRRKNQASPLYCHSRLQWR